MKDKNGMEHDESNGRFTSGGSTPAEEQRAEELLGATRKKLVFTLKVIADKGNPLVTVDLDADVQKKFDMATTPIEKQKIAFEYIMQNLRGKYAARDGRVIAIERIGADKLSHTFNDTKLRVLPELANLIEAGRFRNLIKIQHKVFAQMAYYDVAFQIGGSKFNAVLNVGIRASGDSTLYDINPFNRQ